MELTIHISTLTFSVQAGGPRQEPRQMEVSLVWLLGTDTEEGPGAAAVMRRYHFTT